MNTEQKHTQGPWWRDDDGFIAAGSGDSYVTIADFDCTHDIDIDEREANKSLATAAPDMLAALKRCVDQLSQKRPRKKGTRHRALDFDLELAIAEAGRAIYKAEGRCTA